MPHRACCKAARAARWRPTTPKPSAATAVGAGTAAAVGQGLQGVLGSGLGKVGASAAASVAGGLAAAALRGGRVNVARIAADAFGQVLSSSLVDRIERGGQQEAVLYSAEEQMQDVSRENARFSTATSMNAQATVNGLLGSYWDTHPMMYVANGVQDPLVPRDRLEVSFGGDGYIDSRFEPSAATRFVREYMAQHSDASFDEVQEQYDSAWYAQSDAHLMRQGVAPSDTGSIRPIGAVEGFLTFNSAGRFAMGVGEGASNAISGMVETGKQVFLTASDAVSYGMSSLGNAFGGDLPYVPQSALGRSIQANGVETTALNMVGGAVHGTVGTVVQPLNALYRRNAQMLGQSLSEVALMAGPLTRVGASRATGLPNLMPEMLQQELAVAKSLDISPIKVTDAGFGKIAEQGPVKWAVLENGDLVVVPKFAGVEEIKHSVLSAGKPVLAAGEAIIDVFGNSKSGFFKYGNEINRYSGHFEPPKNSLQIGVDAFKKADIYFKTVNPKLPEEFYWGF